MLQVDFHFNAPEKWPYVCRLLRKISSQGKRTGVCGTKDTLQTLHQSLWNLNPTDFVTHCWSADDETLLRQSGIILSADWPSLLGCTNLDVVLNLNYESILFNTTDLDKFLEILDGLVSKTVLIVTDSSYVLGGDFTDHKVYEGILDTYEILEGRYPHQPTVKFNITIPILVTTKVNLAWIYDKYKLNLDFSSLELVNDFIKTGIPKNELLLVKD